MLTSLLIQFNIRIEKCMDRPFYVWFQVLDIGKSCKIIKEKNKVAEILKKMLKMSKRRSYEKLFLLKFVENSIPCCFACPRILHGIPKPRSPFTNDIISKIFLIRQFHLFLLSCYVPVLLILTDLVHQSFTSISFKPIRTYPITFNMQIIIYTTLPPSGMKILLYYSQFFEEEI